MKKHEIQLMRHLCDSDKLINHTEINQLSFIDIERVHDYSLKDSLILFITISYLTKCQFPPIIHQPNSISGLNKFNMNMTGKKTEDVVY